MNPLPIGAHVSPTLSTVPYYFDPSVRRAVVGIDYLLEAQCYDPPILVTVSTWSVGASFQDAYEKWQAAHPQTCPQLVRFLANPHPPLRPRAEVADNHTGRVRLHGV